MKNACLAAASVAMIFCTPAQAKPLSEHVELNNQLNELFNVMLYAKGDQVPEDICNFVGTIQSESNQLEEKSLQLIQDGLRAMEEGYPAERAMPIYEDMGTAFRLQNETNVMLGAAMRMCIEYKHTHPQAE